MKQPRKKELITKEKQEITINKKGWQMPTFF